jgi:hypothetical protein
MSIHYEVFSIGIEEEYLLIDPETRAPARRLYLSASDYCLARPRAFGTWRDANASALVA